MKTIEPLYTERYVQWCGRSATQLMGSLLPDQVYKLYYRNMVLSAKVFSVFYNKAGRNEWDSAAFGIVVKSKSLDFPTNADYYGIQLIPIFQ